MIDGFLSSFVGISSFDKFGTVVPQDNVGDGEIVERLIDNSRLIPDLKFIINNPYFPFS